jgi:hypothetical protein
LKDTTYTDGVEAHAQRFEQVGPELEALLTTMTSKEIKSQYFTEARKVIPALIRKWGKVLAYVNEQVQAHLAKGGEAAVLHRDQILQEPRAVCAQARRRHDLTVTPLSPAHKQINVREGHHRLALGDQAMTDNRTALRKMRGFGQAVWRHTEGRSLLRSIWKVQLDLEVERLVSPAGAGGRCGGGATAADGRLRRGCLNHEWGGWTVQHLTSTSGPLPWPDVGRARAP